MIDLQALILPIIIFAAVGIVAGLLLTVVSNAFAVKENEQVLSVTDALPGINCGVCGFSGCEEYAKTIVGKHNAPNLCIPGGATAAMAISEIMGIPFEGVESRSAFIHCEGNYDATSNKYDYKGAVSCETANMYYKGRAFCEYGCIGFGDCAQVCEYGAITISNGLAVIDREKCTGCLLCAKRCPKNLILSERNNSAVVVACMSRNSGKVTRQNCKRGCIACKRCEKECPTGAVKVENNLAKINYDICHNCGKCAEVCPMSTIRVYN